MSTSTSLLRRFLLTGLTTLPAACATAGRQPPAPPTEVEWRLAEVDGTPAAAAPAGREPGMRFAADGRVTGFTTCNRFFGRYEAPGRQQLRFAELGSTRMACVDPELARQEQRFMTALQGAERFTLVRDTLVLFRGDESQARFVRR